MIEISHIAPWWAFTLLCVYIFLCGAQLGSFLNVCIYRLPRDMSVAVPVWSFCPECKTTIRWYHNVAIVSWLWLRGRCHDCGQRISIRYILVEALCGAGTLGWFLFNPLPSAIAYSIFFLILVGASVIDFEHYIIPDSFTIGGGAIGLLASGLVPALHQASSWSQSLLQSVTGAFIGYAALRLTIEIGKLFLGVDRRTPDAPAPFTVNGGPAPEDIHMTIDGEPWEWQEIFFRAKDRLVFEVTEAHINETPIPDGSVVASAHSLTAAGTEYPLTQVTAFRGTLKWLDVPREAMGLGDAKFMLCIGAFLGWQGALFSICGAAVLGSVVGGVIAVVRRESVPIPFGPYLAAGALLWIDSGPVIVSGYYQWAFHLFAR